MSKLQKPEWKTKAEFEAGVIERWLNGECASWALESVMEMQG